MNARGASLTEILVVLALLGISVSAVAINLKPLETPLNSGAVLVESFLRQTRRQAMATTSAYRAVPVGTRNLLAQHASSCLDTDWTDDPRIHMELPEGVTMTDGTWRVCFSSRGVSAGNVTITLNHEDYGQKSVEVLIGGTTRILE